jgi:hypothetical protein
LLRTNAGAVRRSHCLRVRSKDTQHVARRPTSFGVNPWSVGTSLNRSQSVINITEQPIKPIYYLKWKRFVPATVLSATGRAFEGIEFDKSLITEHLMKARISTTLLTATAFMLMITFGSANRAEAHGGWGWGVGAGIAVALILGGIYRHHHRHYYGYPHYGYGYRPVYRHYYYGGYPRYAYGYYRPRWLHHRYRHHGRYYWHRRHW